MERIRRFFRKLGKKIGAKGYTLLEVAAVVAVTGTLAAVAMPVVADKIAASKVAAATADVQAIKDSIVNFMKDTGVPPFFVSGASKALPKYTDFGNDATYFRALKTDDGIGPTFFTGNDWPSDGGSLDDQLVTNGPKYSTLTTSAWKGPYLPSIKKDPWGNKYWVVIAWLAEPAAISGSVKQKAAFVISAGPNGKIETKFDQPIKDVEAASAAASTNIFTVVNDDIVSRIN